MTTMIAEVYDALLAAGSPEDKARKAAEAARGLGGGGIAGHSPSRKVDLAEALALSPDLEGHVLENWIRDRSDSAPRSLTSRLGLRLDGTAVELDLRTSCPLLVAGVEGAGKTELLRCLVTSLAARCAPRTVRVALVDPQGGMEQCARLPHVSRRVTGQGDDAGGQMLDWLRDVVAGRERLLRQEQSTSLDHLEQTRPASAPARLLVVADAVLELLSSDAVAELVEASRRGSRLGVHTVLTSARGVQLVSTFGQPGGSTVALRCASPAESEALIGTGDAYAPGLHVGRGFLATGSREVIEFQAPTAGGPPLARLIEAIVKVGERLVPTDGGPGGAPPFKH